MTVLLAGDGPDGFAQIRYRPWVYSAGPNAHSYLEELYVVPGMRGNGIGRALLEAAMDTARGEGATHMELGTSEDDKAARALYESAGFINREGRPDGPVMFFYERELWRDPLFRARLRQGLVTFEQVDQQRRPAEVAGGQADPVQRVVVLPEAVALDDVHE
jgi:GNAT superfamily N-acetyltransferase